MPSTRRRNDLLSRRRRTEDDGEDEGSVVSGTMEDSQSEASLPSDADGDADNSDLSGTDVNEIASRKTGTKNKRSVRNSKDDKTPLGDANAVQEPDTAIRASDDTAAMMNGLNIGDDRTKDEALDFDKLDDKPAQQPVLIGSDMPSANGSAQETMVDRRKREHDQYKKKRDADPAFIPNRGAFFMHDHRSAGPGQNGFRPFNRGRGRGGRGGIGGPFAPMNLLPQASEPTSNPWKHDLHESLTAPADRTKTQQIPPSAPSERSTNMNGPVPTFKSTTTAPPSYPTRAAATAQATAPPRSFDVTKSVATAKGRVFLPGMSEPKPFTIDIKSYAKLPNHRPPLRRDKPVRISLPDLNPRYIFPHPDRSFLFIPRALRPNQNAMNRNNRGRGVGSQNGFSSRRTSVYGGSVHSAAASRRSSILPDFNREALLSPPGSIMGNGRAMGRMPNGSIQHTPSHSSYASYAGTPTAIIDPHPPYSLPQKPTYHESLPPNMHMHQPRPQKQASIAAMEAPSAFPQTSHDQTFHQQVPPHMNGQAVQAPVFYPGSQGMAQPSNMAQAAIHAQPFQPYQQAYQQPMYYYPQVPGNQQQYGPGSMMAPMYAPQMQQPAGYTMDPSQQQNLDPTGMMSYEQNGMVFYYDPSQSQNAPSDGGITNPGYAMPGMGGTMTPVPDGYYYPQMQAGVYYPTA